MINHMKIKEMKSLPNSHNIYGYYYICLNTYLV